MKLWVVVADVSEPIFRGRWYLVGFDFLFYSQQHPTLEGLNIRHASTRFIPLEDINFLLRFLDVNLSERRVLVVGK